MINLKDTRYIVFRNTMLGDVFEHKLQERQLKFNTLKEVILNHTLGVNVEAANSFAFFLDSDKFYKAIACELELFHAKSHLQKMNLNCLINVDPTWKFVSVYYYAFYSATTLLRINRTGIVFLDKKTAKRFGNIATSLIGNLTQIAEGGYVFTSESVSATQTKIILTKDNTRTHQKVWSLTSDFLKYYLSLSNSKNDEYTILTQVISIMSNNNSGLLSIARNRINYQGPSVIDGITDNIYSDISSLKLDDENLFKQLLGFKVDIKLSNYELERFTYAYASLLGNISNKLYSDYRNRSRSSVFKTIY